MTKALQHTWNALPETWTHKENISFLSIGKAMIKDGINLKKIDDVERCMVVLLQYKMIERDGYLIRRNPKFNDKFDNDMIHG